MNIVELVKKSGLWDTIGNPKELEVFAKLVRAETLAEQGVPIVDEYGVTCRAVESVAYQVTAAKRVSDGAQVVFESGEYLYAAPVQSVKQKPVGYVIEDDESYTGSMIYANKSGDEFLPVYLAPVDAKAVRAEALEEAAKVCEANQNIMGLGIITIIAAAIRGLK